MPTRPRFPPEISDYILDILHDENESETPEQCCLVSKSWVPRTRKHLFARIAFQDSPDCKTWTDMFPDLINSPVRYAHPLLFGSMQAIADACAEGDDWIRAFSAVVQLESQNGTRNLYFLSLGNFLRVINLSVQFICLIQSNNTTFAPLFARCPFSRTCA